MRSRTFMSAFARVIISILLVTLLLVQESPPAQASNAAQGSSKTTFILSISQAEPEICVGETVNVTIQWGPNNSYDPGQLPPLTPLAGPSRISMKASLGTFVPDNDLNPGSISGTATVSYTAEEVGTEKLFAVAWIGGSSDAIATDTFKVKACEYVFTLDAEFDLTATLAEVGSHTSRYTVKSYGTLVPTDPNEPRHLEARDKLVKMTGSFTSFNVPKCTLFTWEPATGQGRVDARADPTLLGIGMFLQLAPPRELAWDMSLSFSCDGESATFAGVFPVASSDPWIAATFPSGTGTKRVVLDMFEIPYNLMKGQEGLIVSYVATLTLEKKDSK